MNNNLNDQLANDDQKSSEDEKSVDSTMDALDQALLESLELFEPIDLSQEDPDGWRKYADHIDKEQIEWLKKNPEHDWSGALDRRRAKGELTEEEIRFIDSRPRYSEEAEEE